MAERIQLERAPVEVPSFEPAPAAGPSHPAPEPPAAEGPTEGNLAEVAPDAVAPRTPEPEAAWEPVGVPTPPGPPPAAEAVTEAEAAFTSDSVAAAAREAEQASVVIERLTPAAFTPAAPAELPPVEPVPVQPTEAEAAHEDPLFLDPSVHSPSAMEPESDQERVGTAAPEQLLPQYGESDSLHVSQVPQSGSEVHPGFGGYGAPVTEAPGHPTAESAETQETAPSTAPPPVVETGPNWMLAFVCGWSGGFALFQIGEYLHRTDLAVAQRQLAMGGFASLGLGLLLFGLEALTWGKRREAAQRTLLLLLPLILTVIGLICLYFFHDPDPTKGRI